MGTLEQDTTLTHPTHNYNENRYSRIATGKMKLSLLVLTSFVCALCIISIQGRAAFRPQCCVKIRHGSWSMWVQKTDIVGNPNYGKHCWRKSGCKSGTCEFCGNGNCCRGRYGKDWEDNTIEDCIGKGVDRDHHRCV